MHKKWPDDRVGSQEKEEGLKEKLKKEKKFAHSASSRPSLKTIKRKRYMPM